MGGGGGLGCFEYRAWGFSGVWVEGLRGFSGISWQQLGNRDDNVDVDDAGIQTHSGSRRQPA